MTDNEDAIYVADPKAVKLNGPGGQTMEITMPSTNVGPRQDRLTHDVVTLAERILVNHRCSVNHAFELAGEFLLKGKALAREQVLRILENER